MSVLMSKMKFGFWIFDLLDFYRVFTSNAFLTDSTGYQVLNL